ncbi:MAG: LLM class F420-dependent oxidoreductase [Anaerolineae bacterium]|jgi:F420-dependent oxidoreductase-like protein|nr:LLM class F420-dependent oxidoreductase [Anaerolineae bacterium]
MKIGLQIPRFNWDGVPGTLATTLAQIARTADAAGFASLWVMDHFFQIQMIGAAEEPMLEGYSALNFLAGVTQQARLGTLVTGVIYRHPGVLVKTVNTLDVLSGGRAYLGIGAAWFEREAAGLGIPFPPLKTRFEMLEETLQIAHQMWSGTVQPFHGQHYHLAETLNQPPALSRPHPPILIGGMGETKTLRLVAQYADACNLFAAVGPDVLRHKLETLQRHCDSLKRDWAGIEITTLDTVHLAPGAQSAADVIAQCRRLADLGVQHAIFNLPNVESITPLEIFGREIIPAVAGF